MSSRGIRTEVTPGGCHMHAWTPTLTLNPSTEQSPNHLRIFPVRWSGKLQSTSNDLQVEALDLSKATHFLSDFSSSIRQAVSSNLACSHMYIPQTIS